MTLGELPRLFAYLAIVLCIYLTTPLKDFANFEDVILNYYHSVNSFTFIDLVHSYPLSTVTVAITIRTVLCG